jgi:hypothetical protein
MALGSRLWRPVPVDCWEWLEDLSPLAQRTWFWLWTGPTSTPHGVVSVRPYHAAGALKTKPSALLVALSELEQAGRIVMQQGSPSRLDLYLVGYLPAQCPVRPVQRRGIKKGIERVDLGLPTTQALEEWAIWDAACRKADDSLDPACAEPEPQQKQKQKQEQKPENKQETNASVAKATDTPASPVVTPALELQLTAPAKPQRTLTAGQQDAIFAKQMIRQFAERWNEVMAKHCAPVVAKTLDVKATTLAKNCAVIKHIDEETTPGADLSQLYEWAQARHDYHAGKGSRPWTFEAWHSAEHLAQVFADYRQERLQAGGSKNFAFNVDRTLTQWRESVEYRQQREANHGA